MQDFDPPLILFTSNILSLSSVIYSNFTPVIFKPTFHVNDAVLYEFNGLLP